jgi:hypothetical protein
MSQQLVAEITQSLERLSQFASCVQKEKYLPRLNMAIPRPALDKM